MPAFSLASNSGSFLSTGYTARGFDSYTSFLPTSWQFDAIAWNNINTAPLSTTPSLFDALGGNNLITSVNDGFGNISYEWRIAGSGDSSTVFYYGSGSYGDNIFLPLALDLDGDGVELVSKEDSRAYYDVKGDGFRHNVGWIGADDAFLAIDKNSDGKIELADELSFALWTPDPSDTDLQALKTVFDTNGDDVFNRGDAQFSQFRVWQDANGDGITDAGELKTLAERGIASINLTAAKTDWASGGNHITGFSTFQKADGSNGWAADVGLGHEADGWRATVESSLVRVTQSGGLVYGLANGGASLTADLASQGLDGAVGGNGTDTLTAGHSTGALLVGGDGNDVLNGGARDDWLSGGAGSDILNGGAGGDTLLIDAADMQANINGGDGFDIAVVTGTAGVTLDMFHTKLEAAIGGDGDDRFYTTGTARAVLAGQGGNDLLKSGAGHDVLQGGTGNDTLYGGYGTDTAIYTGNQGDYTFAANADGSLTVRDVNVANGDDGTDTLYGIQTLRFADGDMYVTPSNTGKGETRVNTTTVRDQFFPSVAALADGGYVVTWMDDLAVATDANIYAQRYGVDGNAVGSEFVVNTYAANHQEIPSVTGLADGGFVIVWRSTDQDDSGRGIYGQRYAADGTRAGSEFRVNTYTADHQDDPTIIALNDGGFLVTWQSNLQDGSGYGIYAQRFDTSGVKAGGEFRVNTTASSGQFNAEAVMLTDGGFVMTWSSGAAPNTANIYAQRYDANGIKIGGETKVNTTVYGAEATVTALADGGYVVAWLAIVSGSQWHVFGQRYIADGAAVGGELMLSTSSTGASTTTYNSLQVAPVVTALADGSYVAVWTVYGTTGADIYFRRAMDGNAIGDVVRVNTTTAENQSTPAVTAMPDGGFVVSWTGRDASLNEDVFVQRYDADGKPWTAEQTIAGSAGNDHLNSATGAIVLTLQGLAGNDVLTGGAGNETLDGGAGEDVMSGGAGNDTYVVDTLADVVNENANEGTDTVQTALTYTLGADVENLTLTGATATNGTGNALNNVLTGNSAANVLTGGLGDDTYVVSTGDTVVENASEGIDTVQSNITYTLGANVENLSLTGTTAINGTGNALNNVLTGNSAANILTGGLGDDLYVISTGDTVSEVAGQGTDTVQSPITYTLAANVENLALTGTAAINGTGNTLNNVITGNSAKNVLDGSTGTDTMAGGAGDDTYVVDNVGDVVTENSGEGTDTVQTALTYTLGADVENLTLTGATAINGTGNAQNNTLTGNSAANVLSGGLGDDTYVVSTGDTVVENANEGIDTVQSNITYTLGANVENLTLTGATAINGTGNALNNVLTGNSAANILTGGLGDDTYVVSTGDTVVENASEGIDTVQSNITYTLGANVETLMLTGTTAINGTGNTFNNVLLGNSAANTLDGGVGADTMLGGLGDDIYIVDNSADLALENASEGTDTVQSSVTYSLVSAVENLTLTGVAAINGTGNVLNNTLTGNSAANVLSGGLGDDTYVVSTGDTVVENANEGIDTVQSNITYTLGANVENLTLTGATAINGTGNVLNNTLTGNSAANILTGGLGDDAYVVSTGDTVVENASEGIDTVQSNITYTLGANVENLTLAGTAAINGTGNAADNLLTGNSVANTLDGGLGNDTIVGGTGNDNVLGGAGDDLYLFNRGDGVDTLTDTSGVDTLKFGPGITLDDIEIEAVGADLIVGLRQAGVATTALLDRILIKNWTTAGNKIENIAFSDGTQYALTDWKPGTTVNNSLAGDALANRLYGGEGADTINGAAGADWMSGGTGNDTYVVDDTGDVILEASSLATEIDVVQSSVSYTLGANLENLTLTGTAAINGTGNTQNNVLTGNSAANVLDGGVGNDTLTGGTGNDTYVVDSTGDVVSETSTVTTEIDTVQSSITYTLGANVENLTLTGTAAINGTGNTLNNVLTGNNAANTLNGGTGADTMAGGAGDDTYVVDNVGDVVTENANEGIDLVQSAVTYTLSANVENLTLTGVAAINGTGNVLDNTLTGNSAANVLSGGLGDDTYIVSTGDSVVENANEGIDTVQSNVTHTLGANVENLTLTGTTAINGTGNALNNTIAGNTAANILDGGAGADTLIGGTGNDTYVVDNTGDVVQETSTVATEIDVVQSSVTYTLAANVENLTLTGTAAINGTGNMLNNILTGNGSDNVLDGGVGVDSMAGGLGNDTYKVDNTGDVVTEAASAGTDTVQSSITYTLGANLENLTLTGATVINGTGNTLNNTIIGNGAANVLSGGTGADTMIAGAGDDIYVVDNVGDLVIENTAEGTDLVQSSVTYTLSADVENLTLTGATAINGTGNALNNTFTGNSAANVLTGGLGDDTYIVSTGDSVVEHAGEGIDTVQSNITYTLGANVEYLTLTGATAINGTGNTLNNVLTGNTAANTLNGGAGADTLTGGTGSDTYVVDDAGDTVVETSTVTTEIDVVQSSVSYTLGANLENLTLTGTAAINGTGNTQNNVLTGNSAANVLDGGAGNDTLTGGTGNDTYVVDSTGDAVSETSTVTTEIDTVQSTITYTLGANLENLTLTGTAAINGTGNTLNNVLTGNNAANTLNGGTGADTMAGGAGDDTYVVDNVGDIVTENANEGIDLIQSGVTYTLVANIENLTLTGATAINGTGNELNNTLTGNSAANVLSGGLGDDTYIVSTGDSVVENANEGIDTVQSNVTHTLGANVENLTLTGTTAINGTGNTLNNVLKGNSGVNSLSGAAGNDTLEGLGGADTLTGGTGDDTYILGRGYAADTVIEIDATTGNIDLAQFMSGVAADQIWFRHVSNNLEASIIGTPDKLVIKDWYLGTAYHVEQFKTIDGAKTLLDSQVQNLVNAMASFAPPAAGQTTLPQNYQDALAGVIAANWQ